MEQIVGIDVVEKVGFDMDRMRNIEGDAGGLCRMKGGMFQVHHPSLHPFLHLFLQQFPYAFLHPMFHRDKIGVPKPFPDCLQVRLGDKDGGFEVEWSRLVFDLLWMQLFP